MPVKLLLHTCCAPCSVACVRSLRAEGLEPTALWYNPNIHPYAEYQARLDTLRAYAQSIGLPLREQGAYALTPFLRAVGEDIAGRCALCYASRMRETARLAREGGFTHFTSTLLISPYQNHALLRAAGEQAAAEYGAGFLYRDFRPLYREGREEAKALGLYMQKHCGCIYSEEERHVKRRRERIAAVGGAQGWGGAQAQPTAEETAAAVAARKAAWPALQAAGARFEAALAADAQATPPPGGAVPAAGASVPAPAPATETVPAAPVAAATPGANPLAALLAVQTERVLWEARNVMRCAADSGLWETPYCDMPVWRHVYHMLHSLDRWYMDPGAYAEPAFHIEGLNDLDMAVDAPAFTLLEMEAYLAQTAAKLRAYLAALPDTALATPPEGSVSARLALIVAALRHLTAHLSMLMGFVIAARGAWPLTIGMQRPLPAEDDGLPHYA